jgi:hypothetical protein
LVIPGPFAARNLDVTPFGRTLGGTFAPAAAPDDPPYTPPTVPDDRDDFADLPGAALVPGDERSVDWSAPEISVRAFFLAVDPQAPATSRSTNIIAI